MNRIFSAARFGRYFIYDVKRWVSIYGPTLMLMALAPLLLYLVVLCYSLVFGYGWNTPGLSTRVAVLIVMSAFVAITYPSNVYGFVTDKKAGADFLMLPASVTEKFVSMLLNVLVVVPLVFSVIYFGTDALLCLCDDSCGGTLIASVSDAFAAVVTAAFTSDAPISVNISAFYVIFAVNALFFLLGAIVFKKHKILYPILILAGIQIVLSLLIGALITSGAVTGDIFEWIVEECTGDPYAVVTLARVFNVISVLTNVLMLAGFSAAAYLRLKTLKH